MQCDYNATRASSPTPSFSESQQKSPLHQVATRHAPPSLKSLRCESPPSPQEGEITLLISNWSIRMISITNTNVDWLYDIQAALHDLYMPGKILAQEVSYRKWTLPYPVRGPVFFAVGTDFSRVSTFSRSICNRSECSIPVYKQNRLELWRCGRNSWGERRGRAGDGLDMQYGDQYRVYRHWSVQVSHKVRSYHCSDRDSIVLCR